MAIYKIVEIGDSLLKDRAKAVPKITPNILKLLDNMADTLRSAKGLGLAAPQIGVSKRVIVADIGEGLVEFINPQIIHAEGEEVDTEGCLSVPGLVGEVPRATVVEVTGLNRAGETVDLRATGLMARVLQHEIDHLEGVLFIDRAINVRKMNQQA